MLWHTYHPVYICLWQPWVVSTCGWCISQQGCLSSKQSGKHKLYYVLSHTAQTEGGQTANHNGVSKQIWDIQTGRLQDEAWCFVCSNIGQITGSSLGPRNASSIAQAAATPPASLPYLTEISIALYQTRESLESLCSIQQGWRMQWKRSPWAPLRDQEASGLLASRDGRAVNNWYLEARLMPPIVASRSSWSGPADIWSYRWVVAFPLWTPSFQAHHSSNHHAPSLPSYHTERK